MIHGPWFVVAVDLAVGSMVVMTWRRVDDNHATLHDQLEAEVVRLTTNSGEREAVVMAPRTGSWLGEQAADGRSLLQRDTDMLVGSEVWSSGLVSELASLTVSIGQPVLIEMTVGYYVRRARVQRGGISSDPLVRLFAFRAWGRRDIDWLVDPAVAASEPLIPEFGVSRGRDR